MNLPPPPPPSGSTPPPNWSQPPAGYVAYTGAGQVQRSQGLSRAMVTLYWAAVAFGALSALAIHHRKSVVDDILAGNTGGEAPGTLDDRARAWIILVAVLQVALMLAAVVLTALWCRRVVQNAQARGAGGLNVGWATGGWFVPIAWWFIGFTQLRLAMANTQHDARTVRSWQFALLAANIAGVVARGATNSTATTASELSSNLGSATVWQLVTAAVLAVAAFRGMRAATAIDSALSAA